MADWLHGQEAVSDHSNTEDSLAVEAVRALGEGDVDALRLLLAGHPSLVRARLARHDQRGAARTLLHVATDWPGHLPHGIVSVTLLVQAGADANARLYGTHGEAPLHWAASSDDVDVLDALLDTGADIEVTGAVLNWLPHWEPLTPWLLLARIVAARPNHSGCCSTCATTVGAVPTGRHPD